MTVYIYYDSHRYQKLSIVKLEIKYVNFEPNVDVHFH